jgi:hypothetical protein
MAPPPLHQFLRSLAAVVQCSFHMAWVLICAVQSTTHTLW